MKNISTFYKTILIATVIYLFVQTTNVAYADINTTCTSNLSVANTRYVLTGNTSGNCTVTANNIRIDGQSLYTINGNVTSSNGSSFTLQNVTVTGSVSAIGTTGAPGYGGSTGSDAGSGYWGYTGGQGYPGGPGYNGGTGGSITLSNSTINGSVTSTGGQGGQGGYGGQGGRGGDPYGPYSVGGQGGYGGYGGQGGIGGNAGTITVSGSTVLGAINTVGGDGGLAGYGGPGGYPGYGPAGWGNYGYSGGSYGSGATGTGGGNTTVATSTVSTVTALGTISVSTSTATTIRSSATSAKTFTVASTTFSSILTTSNNASPITVSAPTLNISSKTISATSSALTLNYTSLVTNASTRFSSLASLTINGRNYGAFAGGVFNPSPVGIVTPTANSTLYVWTPDVDWVQSSDALQLVTGCQYSYGDSSHWNPAINDWSIGSPEVGTWQGASCAGTGNDMNAPPEWGTTTLAIRAFATGIATSSDTVTFLYAPSRSLYFYNDGSDPDWVTSGNWFTDIAHASSTGGVLPSYVDNVTVSGSTAPVVDLDIWTQPNQITAVSTGVSFTSSSNASTSIIINGPVTYNGSAKNNGTINGSAIFNDTSSNIGTVVNNAIFNDSSSNTSIIQGSAIFNGSSTSNSGTIAGVKTRYYTATTTTTLNLTGWKVVADGAQVNVASSTYNSTTVFNAINGGSFIGGPTTVYFYSTGADADWTTVGNWYSLGTSTPLGRVASSTEMVVILGTTTPIIDLATTTWIQPSGIDASQTGIIITASTTQTINTGITGSTTISGAVTNAGTISGNTTILGSSKNTGVIVGNTNFYNTSQNEGFIDGDVVFNNSSINTNGGSISGDATFNDSSYNDSDAGTIGGTATFNSTAHNDGTISYNAVFGNNSTENNGTVNGLKTRYFTASSTVNRNFVTGGPWILVADGVEVTIASTSVFNATTTFSEVNGGNFVGEGVPGSYTTCAKPLLHPGTYTLSANTDNTCDVQSDGVVIDGAGYTVGGLPQALPDNASSGGFVDMTGNKLLLHMDDVGVVDSALSNNATVFGAVTSVSGKLSNAANLSGASYLSAQNTSGIESYRTSNRLTVSAWIKMPNPTGNNFGMIVAKSDDNAWQLRMTGNTAKVHFAVRVGGIWIAQDHYSTNTILQPNTWYHVVGTYDGSAVSTYVNGQLDGSYNITGQIGGNTGLLYIGKRSDGYFFNGVIDEVNIWNRALSASEIISQYNSGTGTTLDGNESGLVALYHLDDTVFSNNIVDSSGNSFNGTIAAGVPMYEGSGFINKTVTATSSGLQLNISTNTTFNSNTMTVGGWFKFTNPSTTQFLFGKQDCLSMGGFEVIMSNLHPNKINFEVASGGGWQQLESSTSITDTDWHHIMVTASTTQSIIYIDGQTVGSRSLSGFSQNNGAQFHIGYCRTGYTIPFIGSMDEFGYWNRVLSPSEISAMYAGQKAGGYITGNGYDFDLTNIIIGASVTSAGATLNISSSTIATVNVSGANAVGDAQAGGTLNITNSTITTARANGGNSTDYGYGGAAGNINLTNSTVTSQSATAGSNGPNKGAGQENTGGSSGSSNSITGCMDPSATNYNANANVSGSCIYSAPIVRGCTDPSASNYSANATVNNGSCSYPAPTIPTNNNNGSGNNGGNNGNGGDSGLGGVSLPTRSLGGSLTLKPLPTFTTDVGRLGDTVLGNILEGLKPFGSLNLGAINFSFVLPISEFLFAPLPKSITEIINKSPKLSDTLASVGISRAQDMVKISKKNIKLPKDSGNTPGIFTITEGTTTLDTYITSDSRHELLQLVYTKPDAILNISLIPTDNRKVTGMFDGKTITFFQTASTSVYTVVTIPTEPGRYYINTESSPIPLAIEVVKPQTESEKPLPWWKRVLKWFGWLST